MSKYTYHTDPGHGWLEVPLGELSRLGIAGKISTYSYIHGTSAFLEEDCDAPVFILAKKERGEAVELEEKFRDPTPIRNYLCYQP